MTTAHLNALRTQLERRHWVIVREYNEPTAEVSLQWCISRPNGDTPLTLEFTPGGTGDFRHILLETIEDSIGCHVVEQPQIDLYFASKFRGKFQQDVVAFVDAIDRINR